MRGLGRYLEQHFEQVFVLVILVTVAVINYYIPQKIAFINFYFLPVITAGYLLGSRGSVMGAVLCISLVTIYAILYTPSFTMPSTAQDVFLHIMAWGGFLILAGAVVGKQQESLNAEIQHARQLNDQLIESYKNIRDARVATILGLAKLAEYRDQDTGAHLERIREYVKIIAIELSRHPKYQSYITNQYIEDIYQSSILHDIGKVGIPDHILLKPGKLTKEEFEIIKTHPTIGGDAIRTVEQQVKGQSFLTIGRDIAYYHHEKWDGTGYPKGLKGDEIPLSARFVALADVYDALTSKRIYKDKFPHDMAKEMIAAEKGKHFDPDVVEAFLANADEFDVIREKIQIFEQYQPKDVENVDVIMEEKIKITA